tara:strand:+ start:347 stop:919 length:573 start_codon:yes stop_codon:yes gene_type:complete
MVRKKKIIREAIDFLRKKAEVTGRISINLLAKDLGIELSEAIEYFSSVEEIVLVQQKKIWKKAHETTDKQLKIAKYPADFKAILDNSYDMYINNLPEDADLYFELANYLPSCVVFKLKNKIVYRKKIFILIKKGWPGKTPNILERQTDLVLMCSYGFLEHVVHLPRTERKKFTKDFKNMVNLHLQDRLFF